MYAIQPIEIRGFKGICAFLGGCSRPTAIKRCASLGIFFEKGNPVLNIALYEERSRLKNLGKLDEYGNII